MKKAFIFCNNNYIDFVIDFPLDGTIIAADGGANFLLDRDIVPHVLIGDLDSISDDTLQAITQKTEILRFPVQKDKTDSELALDYCFENKYDSVTLVNAVNGRLEHSLGNIFLIENYVQKGLSLYFINRKNEIFVLHEQDAIELRVVKGTEISLIPLSKHVCVETIQGCKYPLNNEILYRDQTRGISNVAKENDLMIKISSGILLVIRGR